MQLNALSELISTSLTWALNSCPSIHVVDGEWSPTESVQVFLPWDD